MKDYYYVVVVVTTPSMCYWQSKEKAYDQVVEAKNRSGQDIEPCHRWQ